MQTFLPYPSFAHSAAVIDRARLGKQRLESVQLLRTLVDSESEVLPKDMPADLAAMLGERRKRGWVNHPASRMWRGYRPALALYTTFIMNEWVKRGYNHTLETPYGADWRPNPACAYAGSLPDVEAVELPPWVGDNVFHASHRSNLLRKDPVWYGQFWGGSPELQYVWPENMAYERK